MCVYCDLDLNFGYPVAWSKNCQLLRVLHDCDMESVWEHADNNLLADCADDGISYATGYRILLCFRSHNVPLHL